MASYDASDLVPFLRDAAAAIGATVADAPSDLKGYRFNAEVLSDAISGRTMQRQDSDLPQSVEALSLDGFGVLSRNRRKFRQPINVACPAPGRWGRPNSRVTSRHFDHGNASRTSRPDCSGLDEAD